MDYATVADIQALKRPLTAPEQERAAALIPIVSDLIRHEAKKTGRDFDNMIFVSDLVGICDPFEGDGEAVTFTLSRTPASAPTISVNGVTVPADDYTINGTELTFTEAPTGEILALYQYRALAEVARAVVCDVVMREINTPGSQLPATSYSESAGSVSQSYSLPNASGAIKLWASDLKALGLMRQKIGALNLMDGARGHCFPPQRRGLRW